MFEPGWPLDLSGKEGKGGVKLENGTHAYTIDACVSKGSGSRCEVDGSVSRQLIVPFCVVLAPLHHCSRARAIHGYCVLDSRDSLLLLIVYAKANSVREQTVCLTSTLAPCSNVSLYAVIWSSVLAQQGLGSFREATHEEQLILGGASGPLARTIQTMMTGPASGRTGPDQGQ